MKQTAIILSAEIHDFFRITEQLESEEIEDLMNEIHRIINTGIQLHQGKLSNFTGNQFLAAFVSGKSYIKAINASFEIRDQLKSVKENIKLDLKCGIAFGDILSTSIGGKESKQETLMGEVVNNANRICQFAGDNQILVDKEIYEATQNEFEFQVLEPIPLKGGTEILEIFEPVNRRRKKLELSSSGERKIVSEMVGRTREAEQLEGLIQNLVDGKGTIVNIVGKAGIGKSRLMAEMKVQPIMENVLLLEGRALSTGQNLSFHPITNLIRSWAGITEDDLPSVSSEKLYQRIKHNTPEQADEIYAFVATMMGLPLKGKYKERVKGIEGEALEKLILKNLRDLIIAATKDKSRIYLIEDMHWADSSSLTLFESLYKLSQHYPVMFINVMRPGYKETGDYILKYLVDNFPGDHTTINVNPLEEKESGNLIKNLLRETTLPKDIHKMIITKTQGNPFFIEEIIRSFIDEGIIEVKDGNFIVTDKINDVNIPETINEAILSRIDKLDEKTRELLNTASVMGRNFYYKILEEATDTIEELDDRLAYLSEVQLISESKKKQEIEYLFKHALAQQLTYDAMMQQSRKDIHLKIARSIEKVFAANISEYYGTLAYHYNKAENKGKTIQYLILAGDESLKSGASAEALNFYNKGLELLPFERKNDPKDKEILDLNIKIALTHHTLGKNVTAVEQYESIMEKYFNFRFAKTETGLLARGIISMLFFRFIINNQSLFFKRQMSTELEILMKLFNNFGYAYIHLNPKQFALKGLKALEFTSLHDVRQSMTALSFFVDSSILFNFTGISITTAQKMIDFSQSANIKNNPQFYINYRMNLIIQHYFTGNWETEEDFKKTYKEGLSIGKYWTTLTYVYYSGMCAIEYGKFNDFQNRVELLHELAETLDITYAMILRCRLITMGYLKFRNLNELPEISDASIEFIKTTGDDANLFMVYCMRAQGCLILGKIDKAKDALEIVDDKIARHKRVPIFYCQYLVAKLEYKFNELEATATATRSKKYNSNLKELSKISDIFLTQSKKNVASLTNAYIVKKRFSILQNKTGKAFKYLKLAIQTGEKYDGRLELSRAYFETGKFLSDPNNKFNELNGNQASHYLEKAKTMFVEMDLQWDIEECKKFIEHNPHA